MIAAGDFGSEARLVVVDGSAIEDAADGGGDEDADDDCGCEGGGGCGAWRNDASSRGLPRKKPWSSKRRRVG